MTFLEDCTLRIGDELHKNRAADPKKNAAPPGAAFSGIKAFRPPPPSKAFLVVEAEARDVARTKAFELDRIKDRIPVTLGTVIRQVLTV